MRQIGLKNLKKGIQYSIYAWNQHVSYPDSALIHMEAWKLAESLTAHINNTDFCDLFFIS
jgi:hypothetical protein